MGVLQDLTPPPTRAAGALTWCFGHLNHAVLFIVALTLKTKPAA